MPGSAATATSLILFAASLALASPAIAQQTHKVPLSDTEDASVGSQSVGGGRLHPILGLDVRNGDFARGSYDDDAASLSRVPVHASLALVYDLARRGDETTVWLEARTNNGFHAPNAADASSPRAWYESNNLVGLAARLAPHLIGVVSYAIKTSPNDVSATTHEVSTAFSLDGKSALGMLRPGFAATWRPKGGGGLYTQATIEPGIDLGSGDAPDRLSLPAGLGVGWGGFYERGSGTRLFGRAGLALQHPFRIGTARLAIRAEATALFRDDRLRRLDAPTASAHTVRPAGTIALTYAY